MNATLSLFAPPESPSLRELYPLHWEALRTKGTRSCDVEALELFEQVNPGVPAASLTFDHCRKFRRELDARVKAGAMAQNTANKFGRHINRFLRLLGPNDGSVDPEDPDALQPLALLPQPLRIAVPPRQHKEVDGMIDLDESGAFLAAARVAQWINPTTGKVMISPPQICAPHWWTAVWIFMYNSAVRIEEGLLSRRDDLKDDKWGTWLHIRPEVGKTGERMVYLNSHARAAVETLAGCGSKFLLGWEMSDSFLDRLRREIFNRAGLLRLLDLEIGWHGLRKACATELSALGGTDVAKKHLGHRLESTLGNHYLHRSAVCKWVEQLPQPQLGELPPPTDPIDPRQRLLF